MRIGFGFEIIRLKGTSLGGFKAHESHILEIEDRLDRLEHHRTKVAVKTEKELSDEEQIQAILASGTPPGDSEVEDLAEVYHRR